MRFINFMFRQCVCVDFSATFIIYHRGNDETCEEMKSLVIPTYFKLTLHICSAIA